METVITELGLGLIQTKLHTWASGQGTVTWPNGYIYVGDFKESKWHGQGTLTFPDGAAYVGEWRDGFMNGQGSLTLADGKVKKGIWKNGALIEPN